MDELKDALQNEHNIIKDNFSENTDITKRDTADIQDQVVKENIRLNNKILDDKLMPELINNETQKRKLKLLLLGGVFFFITAQIAVMSVFIGQLVYSLTLGSSKLLNLNETLCIDLIGFMKFYVTATLCEFIAMMFFIVRYAFDKSIFELIKLFKSCDETNITNIVECDNMESNNSEEIEQLESA